MRTFFVKSLVVLLNLTMNSGHRDIHNSFKDGNSSICTSPVLKLVSFSRSYIFRYCNWGNITILFFLSSSWLSMTINSSKTWHFSISMYWSRTKMLSLTVEDENRHLKFIQLYRVKCVKFSIPQVMAATWFCQILSIFIERTANFSNFGNATWSIKKLTSCLMDKSIKVISLSCYSYLQSLNKHEASIEFSKLFLTNFIGTLNMYIQENVKP